MGALRHALTVGFANRLARRMDRHNGFKTTGPHAVLAQVRHNHENTNDSYNTRVGDQAL